MWGVGTLPSAQLSSMVITSRYSEAFLLNLLMLNNELYIVHFWSARSGLPDLCLFIPLKIIYDSAFEKKKFPFHLNELELHIL